MRGLLKKQTMTRMMRVIVNEVKQSQYPTRSLRRCAHPDDRLRVTAPEMKQSRMGISQPLSGLTIT